jgi:hypothetical protein
MFGAKTINTYGMSIRGVMKTVANIRFISIGYFPLILIPGAEARFQPCFTSHEGVTDNETS